MLADSAVFYPEISVQESRLLRQMGHVKHPERFQKHMDRVLQEASALWRPRICWVRRRIAIDDDGKKAFVYDYEDNLLGVLFIGDRTSLLDGSEECFISVTTIGSELSERMLELEAEGDAVFAYLMDIAGILALNETHKHFRNHVETYAASRGWGVGAVMQPGSLEGWPLEGQADLLSLLPIDSIGVTLNDRYVMEPAKSNSTLVGVGPGYGGAGMECLCEDCERRNCTWRRTRDYGHV